MGCTYGTLTYRYKVRIDLSNIVDKIADKIGHMDDGYCWEVDGDDLIISAKHTVGYKHWHYDATLESPEEDELEYETVADEIDPEVAVLNALLEVHGVRANIEVDDEVQT